MNFEIKFDLTKNKDKNKFDLSFNTFCVKFVNQLIKNGFTLDKKLDDSSAYFKMELPTKSVKKVKVKHSEVR